MVQLVTDRSGPRRRYGWRTAALLFTAAALTGSAHAAEPRDFVVKAGTMDLTNDAANIVRETQELTMDPARQPGWCFLVDPPNAEPYDVYSVHHLPGQPETLTGNFTNRTPSPAAAGLTTANTRTDGIRPFCFDFLPGDPIGDYRIEVFINGVLKRTVQLHVTPPPTEVKRGGI